jgi:putative peptidoglycan lipid II flippase
VGPAAESLSPDSHEATVRSAAVMSTGTLLSRVTGLARVAVTLAALGQTALSDAYNAANTTPNIVYELVLGGILTSVFVPVFVGWARTHGEDEAREAGSRFLTLVLVVLGLLALLGALFAPAIMRVYLSGGTDPGQLETGVFFLRWFMPQIVFYGLGAVAGGILTANRRFAAQMFAPVLNNVAVICTMLVFISLRHGVVQTIGGLSDSQLMLVAAGTSLGVVAMTLALWPSLRRIGFRWHPRFDWRHETVRRLGRLARWVFVYVAANQAAYIVIINLNHRVGEGAYTAYVNAFVFFSLPHAIVAVSIVTALLPGMAERWADGSPEGVRELCSRGLRDTEVLMIPAAIGYAVLAGPIIALVAEHGAMGAADRDLLAKTLAAFSLGLPFFSAFQLLTRTFYAMHDTKTPALVNIGAAAVNLGADLLFAFAFGWGVPGLALGHAASYAVGSLVLLLLLRRKLGGIDGREVAGTIARTLPAAVLAGAVAWGAATLVARGGDVHVGLVRLVQVGAGVGTGVLVFWLCAFMFGVREVDDVRKAFRMGIRR